MAARKRFGELMDLLLKQYLSNREMEMWSGLASGRQREQATLQSQLRLLEKAAADPAFAERLMAEGIGEVGGLPIRAYVPTTEQALGAAGKELAGKTTLESLPTDLDIEAMGPAYPGMPRRDPRPLEALIAQRNERRAGLIAEKARARRAEPYDITGLEGGIKTTRAGTRGEAEDLGSLPQERTATEQGAYQAAVLTAETPELVKRAGLEAAAQQAAEWLNPAIMGAKIKLAQEEASLRAVEAGRRDWMQSINLVTTTVVGISQDIARLGELSQLVNLEPATVGGIPGRIRAGIGAATQLNPLAAEMDTITTNIARRLANDPFFGGNRGAQSEADAAAMKGRLPESTDTQEQAERKLVSFNKNLYGIIAALSRIDPSAAPADKINTARQVFGLPPIQLGAASLLRVR